MSTFRASWKTQIIRELLLKRYLGCPSRSGLRVSPQPRLPKRLSCTRVFPQKHLQKVNGYCKLPHLPAGHFPLATCRLSGLLSRAYNMWSRSGRFWAVSSPR
jgi:hypothetical protein